MDTPWSVPPLLDCQYSLYLEEFNTFQTSALENETELSQGVQKLLVKTKGERGRKGGGCQNQRHGMISQPSSPWETMKMWLVQLSHDTWELNYSNAFFSCLHMPQIWNIHLSSNILQLLEKLWTVRKQNTQTRAAEDKPTNSHLADHHCQHNQHRWKPTLLS